MWTGLDLFILFSCGLILGVVSTIDIIDAIEDSHRRKTRKNNRKVR